MWDQIMPGQEENFEKHNESDALNVSYDYTSVMHYDKTAFSNGSLPTMIAKDQKFTNIMGQHLDLSEQDILKLNKLYRSNSSLTFLDQCSFEPDRICDIIQGAGDNADWQLVTQAPGEPLSDHTYLGSNFSGHFMHFSTATGSAGDKAYLESKTFHPKRSFQCLQFFSYHSGSADDQLNVWIREYDMTHPNGSLRLMGSITGSPGDCWQLHHIHLNATKPFRVIFEGRKGTGSSSGGLSIDDVNLSETQCPAHTWHIRNFTQLLETTKPKYIFSPRFQSSEGYTFQISVSVNGTSFPGFMTVFFHLTSGENDDRLQWPCAWRQGTMVLMDQNPDIRKQMSNQRSTMTDPVTPAPDGSSQLFWDDPRKVGSLVTDENGTSYYRGPGDEFSLFLSHNRLRSREFMKGDDVFFLLTMEDASHLRSSQTLSMNTQPSTTFETTTQHSTSSPGMAASSLLFTVAFLAALLQ
ncbi:meprin A subunit beta [Amia ocellicauda]|uniref:meprin A subunit beta n=1 Tax=Amia ocellicauda TaxID=2972642 RepID=UPI003463C92E